MTLHIVTENAAELARQNQEAFAMIRRAGFGASDSSVLLGVNPFPDNTIPKLLEQKRSPVVTAEELKIGQMVNVRKGSDLEPLILQKFQEKFQVPDTNLEKPEAMFRIGDTPLTVNFDGVLQILGTKVPVECKFVSTYGGKYYNMNKTIQLPTQLYDLMELGTEVNSIYLTRRAEEAGIPVYYYTQIQQQLLALDADFGYLAALFDKDWELRVFTVMADRQVQNRLLEVAEELWKQV